MRAILRFMMIVLLTFVTILPVRSEIPVNDRIAVDGQIRLRYELDGTSFSPDAGAFDFTTARTLLGFRLRANQALMIRAQFGEARILGTTGSNSPSSASVSLQQIYFDLKPYLPVALQLRMGRFAVRYGNNRILGAGDWSLYGPRTYDGFRLRWLGRAMEWDLFHFITVERSSWVAPSTNDPFDEQDRRLMGVAGKINALQSLFVVEWDGAHSPGTAEPDLVVTPAISYSQTHDRVKVSMDAAYQFGRRNNLDLSAWLFAGKGSYQLPTAWKPTIGGGVDMTSGNGRTTPDTEDHVFYAPFMSRHAYRGFMDYFADVPNGLVDYIGMVSVTPRAGMSVGVDYHYFTYMEEAAIGAGFFTNLGSEVDVRILSEIVPGLSLDAAFCMFFPTESYQPAGSATHLFYLAMVARF